MCTVKEIQEAIREDCKSQHDMVAFFIARKCREKGASMMSEGKTIGQLMEEMRVKAGAQNYHGHGCKAFSGDDGIRQSKCINTK